MEDLHRAILLFYQVIYRRLGRTAWIGRPAPTKKSQFSRYVKPELARLADIPNVPISGTARLTLVEAVQMEDVAITQKGDSRPQPAIRPTIEGEETRRRTHPVP